MAEYKLNFKRDENWQFMVKMGGLPTLKDECGKTMCCFNVGDTIKVYNGPVLKVCKDEEVFRDCSSCAIYRDNCKKLRAQLKRAICLVSMCRICERPDGTGVHYEEVKA